MVRCHDCETTNSVDSKFCKFCGAALPEEELVAAQVKLSELLSEGYRIFNEGRTDEARLVAESALETSPSSTQALSLKAMCSEREGALSDALELYEKVVELNPASTLDKIKVTHLRNQLNAKEVETPPVTRRTALFAAVSAVVLVITVGAIIAAISGGSKNVTAAKTNTGNGMSDAVFNRPAVAPPSNQNPNPQPDKNSTDNGAGRVIVPPVSVIDGGGRLPGFDTSPIHPDGPIGSGDKKDTTTVTETPKKTEPETGPDPGPVKEKENTGIIEITVHNASKTNYNGSDGVGQNQVKALVRAASDQYMLGKYAAAAQTYEKALAAGGDPATINQRIGQCYENLGRKADAISAYIRAVSAYESAMARNNTPVIRSGLKACKQALDRLKNG